MLLKQAVDPRVVLHVGASVGQEATLYSALGLKVIWIEPIPELFEKLQKNISIFPDQKAFKFLVTNDNKTHNFTISSHRGVSSSIFRFESMHTEYWPDIEELETVGMVSTRLDDFCRAQKIVPDTLVLDVEGAELLALEGMGEYLSAVRNLVVEYSTVPLLKGGVLFDELNDWIIKRGFVLKARQDQPTPRAKVSGTFGDALYIRRRDGLVKS